MKAVILDMYGVIIKEPGEGFVAYVNQTFPELTTDEIFKPWFKADVGELTSLEVWEKLGYTGDLEQIEKEYLDTLEINESFFEFATDIKKSYKMGLISNDSSRWSRYLRSKFKLNEYFDAISISGDLQIQKPDERIFRHTLENLRCSAFDCTYVDDRRFNLDAAKSIGMSTILFNSRYGEYEGSVVTSFEELRKFF